MLRDVQVYFLRICIISLCNTIYFSDTSSIIWNRNIGNITRYKRQLNCRTTEFKCKSDECIPEDSVCDGKENCKDSSDETEEECSQIICQPAFFRCAYGACLNKNVYCNNIKDCADGSDEKGCSVTVTGEPTSRTKPIEPSLFTETFQCRSGEYIKEEELCDGKVNCTDSSDETKEECSQIICQSTFFRCAYGACLNKNVHCNGIKDCVDGSDEKGCPVTVTDTTPTPTQTPTPTAKPPGPSLPGSCLIPENPPNGKYTIGNLPEGSYKPGDYANPFNALMVSCNSKFKPNPPQKGGYPICIDGKWTMLPPTCSLSCPPIKSTSTTIVKCRHAGRPLESCDNPIERTIASLECEPLYEEPGLSKNPNRICRDGSWDYPIPECLPICGEKRPQGQVNVIGGTTAKIGDYPWQIGIYTANKSHLCGGSLLNQRVVLSAAHCVTNYDGKLYPKENYLIAAGKYYREYSDPRDEHAQYSEISEMFTHERYRGTINNFEADLVVIILANKLSITPRVQPVCVDWQNEFEYLQLQENHVGVVSGWGFTLQGTKPSEELKELEVPYITYANCFDQVPKEFRKFLTHDKLCAGYLSKNQSVCQGDSGGGLSFAWNQNRYYIRGIVSTSPSTKVTGVVSCDANKYGTYTLVSKYIDFVKDLEIIHRV